MRKIITLPILLIAFVACNSDCPNSITVKQREFLKSKIELNTEKLLVKVEETGYSPAGKKFIEICNSVNAQTQAIIEAIEKGERIAEDDIAELINATNYKYDTIQVDSAFIYSSYNEFRNGGTPQFFITSMLLFNLDVIDNTRELFHSYFQDVEYFNTIVLADDFIIRKGETFKGKAISQAKMVAIRYLYELNDPQTDEGYVELPAYTTSEYDGIISIKGTTVGTHKIKIRSIHDFNGVERIFENEFELIVTE